MRETGLTTIKQNLAVRLVAPDAVMTLARSGSNIKRAPTQLVSLRFSHLPTKCFLGRFPR
jgi:hypothetical protein